MSDPKSPSITWPTGPVIQPRSEQEIRDQAQKDTQTLVAESLKELDDITRAAGDFPEREQAPSTSAPKAGADMPPDPDADRAAFAELARYFAANPPDDGTAITILSEAEFAEETFTIPVTIKKD